MWFIIVACAEGLSNEKAIKSKEEKMQSVKKLSSQWVNFLALAKKNVGVTKSVLTFAKTKDFLQHLFVNGF